MHYIQMQLYVEQHQRELLEEAAREQLAQQCLRAQESKIAVFSSRGLLRVVGGAARFTARVLHGGAGAAA